MAHIDSLFGKDELAEQIALGMVKANPDPTGQLTIYGYTQFAQFNPQHWNHVTDVCRGLIVDRSGNIVARPFRKFWNLNDDRHPETTIANLPASSPLITRKMDGSLGIGYIINGEASIATRGSFTSDQAWWATRYIKEHPFIWPSGFTPLFEIIYPENQIVVKYDYSRLVLLALVDNRTGEEFDYFSLCDIASFNSYKVVESFNRPLEECVSEDDPNEEGYVASWSRPGSTPLRVKIKYETYCRLHKLLTQTSPKAIWEILSEGKDIESILVECPEEFKQWANGQASAIEDSYWRLMRLTREAYDGYFTLFRPKLDDFEPLDRRHFAEYAKGFLELTPLIFAMLDKKNLRPLIFRMIKPRGDLKTFKADVDN